jgi:surface antigen
MRLTVILAFTVSCVAAGCAQKADTGTLVGAVAGGAIGNQFGKGGGRVAATAAGAVIGGIVGHEIGRQLDERDRLLAEQAYYRAMEDGQSGAEIPWENPDSGRRGTFVPGRPYMSGAQHCRTYTHTIYIDGRPEMMRGTACRQPNGTWQNVG